MAAIGIMAMPENFKYASVFQKGKPQHDFYDTFRIRHPKMANGKRAKIFSAFDALDGFGETIKTRIPSTPIKSRWTTARKKN